jgi:hypothetical protein
MAMLPSAMLTATAKTRNLIQHVFPDTTHAQRRDSYQSLSIASARDPPVAFNISEAAAVPTAIGLSPCRDNAFALSDRRRFSKAISA